MLGSLGGLKVDGVPDEHFVRVDQVIHLRQTRARGFRRLCVILHHVRRRPARAQSRNRGLDRRTNLGLDPDPE